MSRSSSQNLTDRRGPLLVALTGGVASGKTAVSDHLSALGVPIVDTDRIARDVVAPDTPGLAAVASAFGEAVVDASGALDRRGLRQVVFQDSEARERLESILHPLIEREARRQIARHSEADYVVVVVPLLIETGLFGDADRVVVVDVAEDVQIQRLVERDGIDCRQARAMLDAQASRQERLDRATDVIDNNGDLAQLERAVDALHNDLVAVSRHRNSSRTT